MTDQETTSAAKPVVAQGSSADTRSFELNETGGGAFGRWTLDSAGLPAYRYEMDQYADLRALYPNTEGLNRRDHWHQIGNDRVTGLASNDGTVQLYIADRGGTFFNRYLAFDDDLPPGLPGFFRRVIEALSQWYSRLRAQQVMQAWNNTGVPRGSPAAEPFRKIARKREGAERYAYVGGYSYLDDGTEVWASAFRYRPRGAKTRRVFGMGYYETETTYRNIRVTRHVYAPYGNDPILLVDVKLDNLGSQPVELRHYEYWDVNVYQLRLQWLRTGLFAPIGDDQRCAINERFLPSISWNSGSKALRFHQQPPDNCPSPDAASDIDWAPADVFLADLSDVPAGHYADKYAFFGDGGARQPDAARERHESFPDAPSTDPMPYCLVLRQDIHLEPGASIRLRYAYGAVRPQEPLDFLDKYRTNEPLAQTLDYWKGQVPDFRTESDLPLQREMAWHAYNLISATVYNSYYGAHLVPQGSAYLFLHGADGAPRDQALFSLPLIYLRPDLARDILRLIMSLTHAEDGAIPYAFYGHGLHSDGLGIHAAPSDLDLFFLLALSEYLAATGDRGFLDMAVPFYPRGARPACVSGTTVLDHVRVAVTHLIEKVGIGDHGLIKIGDGDWSDGIVFETQLKDGLGPLGVTFEESKSSGESVPNTQMALHVLPLAAALVESHDSALTARMRDLLPGLRKAVEAQWTGRWYMRAILRTALNEAKVIGADAINLESQPWALISGVALDSGNEIDLVNAILPYLDSPSPIGATLVEKGMVWPAVSQLLTWGYCRCRPDLAWRSFQKHLFAVHAREFPNTWINIWSGPDGINGKDLPNPGGTWASPVTPMLDFPVMNANQDAMALLALLRVCGIEPIGDGLVIAPQAVPKPYVLDTALLRLEVGPGRIAGLYRAATDGNLILHVRAPNPTGDVVACLDDVQIETTGGPQADLPLTFKRGQVISFEVTWNR